MENLKKYYTELKRAQKVEQLRQGSPYIARVENPKGTCNTLWIPVLSGNRTASVNLNHELLGFDENGTLWGANGNCGTLYVIVEIPSDWPDNFDSDQLNTLSEIVCKKLGKSKDYPRRRVLKADQRLPIILEAIKEMS